MSVPSSRKSSAVSRTFNSLRNVKFALGGQMIGLAVSFLARMVFVRYLSAEHLGLNGLFANILTMLSVAELGIGSAIIFSMYEPLSRGDETRLRSLMGLYRRAYLIIGIVVGVVGASLTPFLPYVVGELPSIPYVNVIYLLFVANSASAYFFSYKRAFLIADQKRYIATMYRYSFFVVLNMVQIAVLAVTANYVLFLAAQLVFTLAENIVVARRVDRMYPFLRVYPTPPLKHADRVVVTKNLKAMAFHRLGGVVVTGTDSVVMSVFAGVIAVGLYSNYLLITGGLTLVLGVVFSSVTASVGNLGVEGSEAKQLDTFWVVDLAVTWSFGFAAIASLVLFNPFIELWLGSQFLFDMPVVLAIVAAFYLTGVRTSIWVFKDAKGLFWPDRFRPVVEVAVNLVVSVVLASRYGVIGVLIGTVVSTVIVCLPWEPWVLFKRGFEAPVRLYFRRYVKALVVAGLAGSLSWWISSFVVTGGLLGLMLKAAVCLIIPNLFYWVAYGRGLEFRRLLALLLGSSTR